MTALPELAQNAWETREGFCVFSTTDSQGIPNSIYVAYAFKLEDDQFVIADISLNKTRENIQSGSKGSLLYLTSDYESFQLKGEIEYHTNGGIFTKLNELVDNDVPVEGAVLLKVDSIFCDGNQL